MANGIDLQEQRLIIPAHNTDLYYIEIAVDDGYLQVQCWRKHQQCHQQKAAKQNPNPIMFHLPHVFSCLVQLKQSISTLCQFLIKENYEGSRQHQYFACAKHEKTRKSFNITKSKYKTSCCMAPGYLCAFNTIDVSQYAVRYN